VIPRREQIATIIAEAIDRPLGLKPRATPFEYEVADEILGLVAAGEQPTPPELFGDENGPPSLLEWLYFVDGITSFVVYRGLDDEAKRDLELISARARKWVKSLKGVV
jgi:hypothetical protein